MWLNLGEKHDAKKRRAVIHEFGHALGLSHEHKSPLAPDMLLEEVVINDLMKKHKIDEQKAREKFQRNFKRAAQFGEDQWATEYDANSIMQYG